VLQNILGINRDKGKNLIFMSYHNRKDCTTQKLAHMKI